MVVPRPRRGRAFFSLPQQPPASGQLPRHLPPIAIMDLGLEDPAAQAESQAAIAVVPAVSNPSAAAASSSTLFIVDGAGGESVLFSDAAAAVNMAPGAGVDVGADILHQALQEVVPPDILTNVGQSHQQAVPPSVRLPNLGMGSIGEGDLSFLLETSSTSSVDAGVISVGQSEAVMSSSTTAGSNEALIEELVSVAAVDTNTAAAADLLGSDDVISLDAVLSPPPLPTSPAVYPPTVVARGEPSKSSVPADSEQQQVVTVVRSADGTLRLTAEQVKLLGCDRKTDLPPAKAAKIKQPTRAVAATAAVVAPAAPTPTPTLVLVPVTKPDGSQGFVVKAATSESLPAAATVGGRPVVVSARPQQVPPPRILSARPTIVASNSRRTVASTSLQLTSAARPVMSPAVATAAVPAFGLERPQPQTRSHQPLILPKMALLPAAVGRAPRQMPVILPKTVAPSATTASPTVGGKKNQNISLALGKSGNPIQLVRKGHSFHTSQPLSNVQLTQVANALRKSDVPGASSAKETEIVVDRGENSKTVYKIVFPEDEDEREKPDSGEESDYDERYELEMAPADLAAPSSSSSSVRIKTYQPHELFPDSPLLAKKLAEAAEAAKASGVGAGTGRKRGRPRRADQEVEKPEEHIKKLRREFGLTKEQLQSVEKDIVSDRDVKLEMAKEKMASSEQMEEVVDVEERVPTVSRTRSGRLSKPPAPKDEEMSMKVEPKRTPPQEPVEPQPKRRFQIQERYRCRVCHKVYLGDRKMNRHVKLYPSHGPMEEPPPRQLPPPPPPPPPPTSMPYSASAMMSAGKKMPEFSIPIIPMARTQLEELVKNLDAELVLDVVAKKMFDNFAMWDLETRKTSMLPGKGIKRLAKLFDDLEKMVGEAKKVVDNCLTDAKLYSASASDGPDPPGVIFGDNMQSALGLHEGPWYMEPTKHIPEEYHKLLDIQPEPPGLMMTSPRSDSNAATAAAAALVGGSAGDEENSNSMMSMASSTEKGGDNTQGGTGSGGGAPQLVLEKNLGTGPLEDMMDEDTQDCNTSSSAPTKKRTESELEDSKQAGDSPEAVEEEEEEEGEEEEEEGEDDSNMSSTVHRHDQKRTSDETAVDPKKVLEQHGINISGGEDEQQPSSQQLSQQEAAVVGKIHNVSSSDLAREIDSLGPFTSEAGPAAGAAALASTTKLPSFSTIIGGGGKDDESLIPSSSSASAIVTTSSVLMGDQGDLGLVTTAADMSGILEDSMGEQLQQRLEQHAGTTGDDVLGEIMQQAASAAGGGPASVSSHISGPPSVQQQSHHQQHHISGPSSVHSVHHISGPPSVDHHHQPMVSGPPSVDQIHLHQQQQQQHHVSGPPSIDHARHMSGPPSVHSVHVSGPPSVDHQLHHHQQQQQQHQQQPLPGSPCVPESSSLSVISHTSNPPSVVAPHHYSNPPSIDTRHHQLHQQHQSGPPSPFSEVLGEVTPVLADPSPAMRRNSISAMPSVAVAAAAAVSASLASPSFVPTTTSVSLVAAAASPAAGLTDKGADALIDESAILNPDGFSQQQQTGHEGQRPAVDSTADPAAQDIGSGGVPETSSFLSDLDSVLADDVDNPFPFRSALTGGEGGGGPIQLKTPEKILQSVPPGSILKKDEDKKKGEGKTEEKVLLSSSAAPARTSFLGALSAASGAGEGAANPGEASASAAEASAGGISLDDLQQGESNPATSLSRLFEDESPPAKEKALKSADASGAEKPANK